jgi:hypothetical protein
MFDGTDLSLAYGAVYEPAFVPPPAAPPVPQNPSLDVPKATAPHAQPPEVPYTPPAAMYTQQTPQAPANLLPPQDSFWDRLSQKKVDVTKLFVLAMVVLLGISMDRVATHYLTSYVGKAFLSDTQEFLVRLSYPVIVIVVLWLIKALA